MQVALWEAAGACRWHLPEVPPSRNARSAGEDPGFKRCEAHNGLRAMIGAAADAALQGAALCSALGEVSLRLLSNAAHSAVDSGSKVRYREMPWLSLLPRLLAEPRPNNSPLAGPRPCGRDHMCMRLPAVASDRPWLLSSCHCRSYHPRQRRRSSIQPQSRVSLFTGRNPLPALGTSAVGWGDQHKRQR